MDEPKRARPVNWYNPQQLLQTGIDVLITSVLRQRADVRRIVALGSDEPVYEAPAARDGALWIDFAADTGDGFLATYSVAHALAHDLVPQGRAELTLRAGQMLILGGDQVYPTPDGDAYQKRFLGPFQNAAPAAAERPLFAIPGNHDWYDGLTEFERVFCIDAAIGPWRTQQSRSYFALRLSPLLWCLCLDTQLCQDIDRGQLMYFLTMIEEWEQEGETPPQIIVVTPEPHWEHAEWDDEAREVKRVDVYRQDKPFLLGKLLLELEQRRIDVVLQLTGDLHHYRRYATDDGRRHLITAGGAGAFTHPTHTRIAEDPQRALPGSPVTERYECKREFPEPADSRALARRNLYALNWLWNWPFAMTLGVVYLVLGLIMPRPPSSASLTWDVLMEAIRAFILTPSAILIAVGVLSAVILFTDTTSKRYRLVAAPLHAFVHLVAALLIAWALRPLHAHEDSDLLEKVLAKELCYYIGTVLCGGLLGSFLWGAYLYISVNWYGRHSNESFSSLRVQDYRCFLRMELRKRTLTVYPLGLRRVPRDWAWDGKTWNSKSGAQWHLLEEPISIALNEERGKV